MRPRTNSGHSLSRFSVPLLPKPLFRYRLNHAEFHFLGTKYSGDWRKRRRLAFDGAAGGSGHIFPLFVKRTTFRTSRRPACGAIRGRAANRGCRLGIVCHCVGSGRRHAPHGRARFRDHYLGRRASPWPDLQYTQFREWSRLDQSIGVLAIGDSGSFSNVSCDVPVEVSFHPFSCQMRMNSPNSRGKEPTWLNLLKFHLMADTNMKWTVDQAIRSVRAFQPFDPVWL
jgi:hypothetical protein